MKNYLLYALLMFCMLSCTSSNSSNKANNEELKKAKEAVQFQVDIAEKQMVGCKINFMTRCVSIDFDGTNVVYTYEIDEDYATIDQLKNQRETLEQAIKSNIEANPQIKSMTSPLKKIGGKLVYNYVGDTSKKILTLTIEP